MFSMTYERGNSVEVGRKHGMRGTKRGDDGMVKDEDPIVVYERVPPCPGHDDRCVIVIFIVSPPLGGR